MEVMTLKEKKDEDDAEMTSEKRKDDVEWGILLSNSNCSQNVSTSYLKYFPSKCWIVQY